LFEANRLPAARQLLLSTAFPLLVIIGCRLLPLIMAVLPLIHLKAVIWTIGKLTMKMIRQLLLRIKGQLLLQTAGQCMFQLSSLDEPEEERNDEEEEDDDEDEGEDPGGLQFTPHDDILLLAP